MPAGCKRSPFARRAARRQNGPVGGACARKPRARRNCISSTPCRAGAAPGLAAIGGVTVYLAVAVGRSLPLRAAIWASVVFGALYLSRRLRGDYRSGAATTSRPFRWRANYTSSLAVLGAAFGAGAYLLTPAAGGGDFLVIYLLLLSGVIFAAGAHSAHAFSAAAVAGPAIAFVIAGAYRGFGVSPALSALIALAACGLFGVYVVARGAAVAASAQFPRSTYMRRDRLHTSAPATATTADEDTGAAPRAAG